MRLYQWNAGKTYDGVFFDIEDLAGALPERTTPKEPHAPSPGQESHWSGDEWQLREIQPLPQVDVDWPALIASRRWQAEGSGILVEGVEVDTGRESQGLITGAAVSAMLDSNYSLRWKCASGEFISLNSAQVLGLATAVRQHVQACFDREADLLISLSDGTFTEDMIDDGWPETLP